MGGHVHPGFRYYLEERIEKGQKVYAIIDSEKRKELGWFSKREDAERHVDYLNRR